MESRFDAVIVGGGPAGATAAILLAGAGRKVAIVERSRFPRGKVCGEYISPGTWRLLASLGVLAALERSAGPRVERVGLFTGEETIAAPMPHTAGDAMAVPAYGRAVRREILDRLLLERAAEAGAIVLQPWRATGIERSRGSLGIRAASKVGGAEQILRAPIAIAAHGSWESGALPTQAKRRAARASDLLAFKARYRGAALARGLMPLIAFPGGYGGMVEEDGESASLSVCIRRDRLERLRRARHGSAEDRESAAACVEEHVKASVRGVREALAGARREGSWLAAGPIRPGIRAQIQGGVFLIGNAAGEAHPIVAEGISMAVESAWLLCERILAAGAASGESAALARIARSYERAWRASFAGRIRAAALFAGLARRPCAAALLVPLLRRAPRLLTRSAAWSGKDRVLARPANSVLRIDCAAART